MNKPEYIRAPFCDLCQTSDCGAHGDAWREQEYKRRAAPDLYAALESVIASHCGNENLFCGSCTPARAALAKARGES